MDLDLENKITIVTGSGWGIGKAIAKTFAEEKAKVVVAEINEERLNSCVEELKGHGADVLGIHMDVSKDEDVKRMVKETYDKFGRIDILVNNAAYWTTKYFMDTDANDWEREAKIVHYGVLNCIQTTLRHMMAQNSGVIVNIGSDAGRVGEPIYPTYSAVKAGVIAFTKAIAKDVGKYGIRVNCVSPGRTNVERLVLAEKELMEKGSPEEVEKYKNRMEKTLKLYPLRRFGTPQDLANMVVFIASDRCSYVTGQTISINGGYAMF